MEKSSVRKYSQNVPRINVGTSIQDVSSDQKRKSLRISRELQLSPNKLSVIGSSSDSPRLSPNATPRDLSQSDQSQSDQSLRELRSPRGHSYKNTKHMIQAIGGLDSPRFWANKFKSDFPDSPYFDFWSEEENYLVQTKETFCVIVDILNDYEDGEYCQPYLFEYSKFVNLIYGISDEKRSSRFKSDLIIPINMKNAEQFIVIKKGSLRTSYHKNRENALKHINVLCTQCMLIDISGLSPYFFSHGNIGREVDVSQNSHAYFAIINGKTLDVSDRV
jgi:hypothetical protein